MVAGQDDNNVVLVAHEAHAPGGVAAAAGLVGFMVVTSEVDVTPLADAFDLHPYDSFLPEDVYEAQYNAARDALRIKKVRVTVSWPGLRPFHFIPAPNWVAHAVYELTCTLWWLVRCAAQHP